MKSQLNNFISWGLLSVILATGIFVLFLDVVDEQGHKYIELIVAGMVLVGIVILVIYYYALFYLSTKPQDTAPHTRIYEGFSIRNRLIGLFIVYLVYTSLFSLEYYGLSELGHYLVFSGNTKVDRATEWLDFFYFSFTTASTLGIGDFIPNSNWVRLASIIEVSFGPLLLFSLVLRISDK